MYAVDRVIDELAGYESGDLTVFCGAGISFNSGLPTAIGLLDQLLDELDASAEDRDRLIQGSRLALPFESFMEVVIENSHDPHLLGLFREGAPNVNHAVLAALMRSGVVTDLYTTNFDTLIETALRREGLSPGSDFEVYFREEDLAHDVLADHGRSRRLFKLHGSVDDLDSIRTTLQAVSNRLLSISRQAAVRRIFSGERYHAVLILGYSCSDYFDILPEIERIEGSRTRVVIVDHTPALRTRADCRVEPVSARGENNPFTAFHGWRLAVDTDAFIGWLIGRFGLDYQPVSPGPVSWRDHVREWRQRFPSEHIVHSIMGQLFYRLSESERALFHYRKALEVCERSGNVRGKGAVLNNIGLIYQDRNEHSTAVPYHEQALECFRQIRFEFGIAAAYANLGFDYAYSHPARALKFSRQALVRARTLRARLLESNVLNNIGLVYKNLKRYNDSLSYYQRALELDKEGDRLGEVISLMNVGTIYRLKGEPDKAIDYNRQALDTAEKIGYKLGQAQALKNLAQLYDAAGEATDAVEYRHRSDTIARAYHLSLH